MGYHARIEPPSAAADSRYRKRAAGPSAAARCAARPGPDARSDHRAGPANERQIQQRGRVALDQNVADWAFMAERSAAGKPYPHTVIGASLCSRRATPETTLPLRSRRSHHPAAPADASPRATLRGLLRREPPRHTRCLQRSPDAGQIGGPHHLEPHHLHQAFTPHTRRQRAATAIADMGNPSRSNPQPRGRYARRADVSGLDPDF